MSQQLNSVEARFNATVARLAQQFANDAISIDDLRQQLRRAIGEYYTGAVLLGTGGQRSADVDRLIRQFVSDQQSQLDAFIALVADGPRDVPDLTRRMEGFTADGDEAAAAGEQLAATGSDLIAIATLTGLVGAAATLAQPRRQTLPRIDSRALRGVFDRTQGTFDTLADQLAAGEITLDEWRDSMGRELTRLHVNAGRIGAGGQRNEGLQRLIAEQVQRQRDYLDRWAGQLAGQEQHSAAGIKQRASLYTKAANATLQQARTVSIGLPLLPAYPGDASTECLGNCYCSWQIFQLSGSGNYDCYWRLRPADHCDQCVARATRWSPIEVRGGVLQPYDRTGAFA